MVQDDDSLNTETDEDAHHIALNDKRKSYLISSYEILISYVEYL